MNKEKLLKDAQYRKGLSIAFFNATNSAIALAVANIAKEPINLDTITKLRDFFLKEHAEYYANVIANVGENFNLTETIAKIEGTTTLDDLTNTWRSLSEDERKNAEVLKVASNLKKKYEKT